MTRHPFGVPSPWMTSDEAADYAHVSKAVIKRLVRTGALRAYALGDPCDWAVHRAELDELIRQSPVDPEQAERRSERQSPDLAVIDLDPRAGAKAPGARRRGKAAM